MKVRNRSREKLKRQASGSGKAVAGRLSRGTSTHKIIQLDSAFGSVFLNVELLPVGAARICWARLIRESTKHGRAFLIQDAIGAGASSVLLISPDVLNERLKQMTRPTRTGAQMLENLPFKRRGSPRLTVEIEDDVSPALIVRTRAGVVSVPPERDADEAAF